MSVGVVKVQIHVSGYLVIPVSLAEGGASLFQNSVTSVASDVEDSNEVLNIMFVKAAYQCGKQLSDILLGPSINSFVNDRLNLKMSALSSQRMA